MDDFFYWTGDGGSIDEPKWLVEALRSGIVCMENGGTPEVCLVIHGRRFRRNSVIMRRDVEGDARTPRHRRKSPTATSAFDAESRTFREDENSPPG